VIPEHQERPLPEQRWLRIITVAFVMYTIAFVDRTNISLALPTMSRDLHMDPEQAGSVAGVFFWGYLLLQIPGGYLAQRWSAKRFVSVLLVAWGCCSMLCGLVHSARELWTMRLLLGVAEGGVWPATLVLLANWFPRGERARANAFWMLCLPVAVIVSSPVSGWILNHWNWRVLLVSEGALPFVWLLIWHTQISDHPREARWISAAERDYLERTLERESADLEPVTPVPFLKTLLQLLKILSQPKVWAMIVIYFLLNCGNYGFLFWLPSALEHAHSLSHLETGILFSVPYVLCAVGMVLVSRHSDRTHERRQHVAGPLAWTGSLLLASVLVSGTSPLFSFALICLVGAGSHAAHGSFWAIPTETLPRAVSGSAMGLINALGNLGGFFGPLSVGYFNKHTGNFFAGFVVLALALLAASGLALAFLPPARVPANAALSQAPT
jgi:sugar phosphate permease